MTYRTKPDLVLVGRVNAAVAKHGSLRAAARALKIEPSYLCRLRSGKKVWPSDALLKKIGLRRVVSVTYVFTDTRTPVIHINEFPMARKAP